MEAFLISTGIVALAEMGDKTQLLSLVLAARFRKPIPIILGILVATLLNHAGAGALGTWVTTLLGPDILRWVLAVSFIAMAGWMLIPDKLDDEENEATPRWGVFGATVVAFFLAEMGDKTQIATIALAAQYSNFFAVVSGTTLGMMIANVPVVFFGEKITTLVPIKIVHRVTAAIFLAIGVFALLGQACSRVESLSLGRLSHCRACVIRAATARSSSGSSFSMDSVSLFSNALSISRDSEISWRAPSVLTLPRIL